MLASPAVMTKKGKTRRSPRVDYVDRRQCGPGACRKRCLGKVHDAQEIVDHSRGPIEHYGPVGAYDSGRQEDGYY